MDQSRALFGRDERLDWRPKGCRLRKTSKKSKPLTSRSANFAKLIWQLASPKWNFDDATFDRTAESFNNPDHVAIVIHNYRWRIGLADGERKYDELDARLAKSPAITVPTITMEGDDNGAPHGDASSYAKKFAGKYTDRVVTGGVGHNLPQEAPEAFAKAIVDVDRF